MKPSVHKFCLDLCDNVIRSAVNVPYCFTLRTPRHKASAGAIFRSKRPQWSLTNRTENASAPIPVVPFFDGFSVGFRFLLCCGVFFIFSFASALELTQPTEVFPSGARQEETGSKANTEESNGGNQNCGSVVRVGGQVANRDGSFWIHWLYLASLSFVIGIPVGIACCGYYTFKINKKQYFKDEKRDGND